MLPALPSRSTPLLDELTLRVSTGSAALGRGLPAPLLDELARLLLRVNSYYTNGMEGNPSKLKDIDAALEKRLDADPARRSAQLEHLAHIEVQEEMLARLAAEPGLRVCSADFLRWLHERFFLKLPEELRFAVTESGSRVPVVPGALRGRGITVGRHDAPAALADIERHLADFERLLDPSVLAGPRKLVGLAASHHRFLWIHPFPEGNGRVGRLLTAAYAVRAGLGEHMLWTPARAFARDRAAYDAQLARADRPRRNDLDGRGPLSEEDLLAFCEYFLSACAEQIDFMAALLRPEELAVRYRRHLAFLRDEGRLSASASLVMSRLLLAGEVPRGEIPVICSVKKRRASQIARELTASGLARSATPYGPLRLNLNSDLAAALFPRLA